MAPQRRQKNPYIAGAPLRGESGFFGRQDTLEWVTRELRNRNTNALVLFGQRRIGKTTLLLQLRRSLPREEFLPVYFDLQDQASRTLGVVLFELADTIADLLDLDPPDEKAFDNQGRYFRRTFLPLVYETLGENLRPVFLFDEFDVLETAAEADLPKSAAAKALFPFLRRVMTDDERPAFVFVVGRRAEDLSLNFTQTFKSSLVYEIWVLDPTSAELLVRQAEDNGSLKFEPEAVGRILALTNFHPYLTQLFCQRIWERAYADKPEGIPTIGMMEIEDAVADALEKGNQALEWLWDGLTPAEKIYASALAEIASEGETISEDQVIKTLTDHATRLRTRDVELAPRDLVKRHVLDQAGERRYKYAVELFRLWVHHNKPLDTTKDELDQVSPIAEELYQLGMRFFNRGTWASAARYFQDALENHAQHFRARLQLGETYYERGDYGGAVEEFEKAYLLDADETRLALARALISQANAALLKEEEETVLALTTRALEVSPSEKRAMELANLVYTRQGDRLLNENNLENALNSFIKAGNKEKVHLVRALLQRNELAGLEAEAYQLVQAKNWDDATETFSQLVSQAPDDESRAAWQIARDRAMEEAELREAFEKGLASKSSLEAIKIFLNILNRRPDFELGGRRASELLDNAIRNEPNFPKRFPLPILEIENEEITFEEEQPQQGTDRPEWPSIVTIGDGSPEPNPVSTETMTFLSNLREITHFGEGKINTVAFSPDGTLLASGGDDTKVWIWRIPSGTQHKAISGHTQSITSVMFSPDGTLLASGSDDKTTRLWGTSMGKQIRGLKTGTRSINSVAFSPTGNILASGSGDASITIWRVIDSTKLFDIPGNSGAILSIAFSPDGTLLATGGVDNTIHTWDFESQKRVHVFKGHTNWVSGVSFSPDGTLIASSSNDNTVRLWQVQGAKKFRLFKGHMDWVTDVAFSPDGTLVASCSRDRSIRIWGARDGKQLQELSGHTGYVNSVAFSPDGTLLASGSNDGTIRLWGAKRAGRSQRR